MGSEATPACVEDALERLAVEGKQGTMGSLKGRGESRGNKDTSMGS